MKTENKIKSNLLISAGKFTTEQMFLLNAEIGDFIFNTDIQDFAKYTNEGWKDFNNNLILNTLFFEDFESGDLLAWNVVNDTVNKFIVGQATAFKGLYSLFISNDNLNPAYTNNQTQISHVYKDIILPNSNLIKLTAFWKCLGELNYDYGRIYIMPTTETPQARILPSSAYAISELLGSHTSWQKSEYDISAYKNTTIRLVFTWRNDGSIGNSPAICFDNILINHL